MKQKKILSLLLSVLLLLSLAAPAFAAGSDTCRHSWLETSREAQGYYLLDVLGGRRRVLVYRVCHSCVIEGCDAILDWLEIKRDDLYRHLPCRGAEPLSLREPIDLLM